MTIGELLSRAEGATPLERRACEFAMHWHERIGQRRRYTGLPYIVHPAAVAELVRSVSDDEAMLAAAWLHDVVEDTPCTLAMIEAEFGADVTRLVAELTDVSKPEDGNRATRKAIDRAHTAAASARAKTVKLADLIDNGRDILAHDRHFARAYMREKCLLLEVLREGNPRLWHQAYALVQEAYELLGLGELRLTAAVEVSAA